MFETHLYTSLLPLVIFLWCFGSYFVQLTHQLYFFTFWDLLTRTVFIIYNLRMQLLLIVLLRATKLLEIMYQIEIKSTSNIRSADSQTSLHQSNVKSIWKCKIPEVFGRLGRVTHVSVIGKCVSRWIVFLLPTFIKVSQKEKKDR